MKKKEKIPFCETSYPSLSSSPVIAGQYSRNARAALTYTVKTILCR